MTESSIFDRIRAGFSYVAVHADHVHIDRDRLVSYANSLPAAPPDNLFDTTHHYEGDAESTAAYVLTLDAINFGSGYEPLLRAENWDLVEDSIYFTLSTRLKQAFEAAPLQAETLAGMTAEKVTEILKLPAGPYSREFSALCAAALQELGAAIKGPFFPYITNHKNAASLVESLAALSYFHDVQNYKGHEIPILKRAQIAVADLHLAFVRQGRDLFPDIAALTMFADNAVPHVLRTDGLLVYSDDLATKIASNTLIPIGSAMEVEIRACAGHAVELLAQIKGLTAVNIDHILWHRSAENPHYRKSPTHRTLTHFY